MTPRYPQGLPESELRTANFEIQRETAMIWFVSNFKPYSLVGGHYFTFNTPGKGFGQAPFAPPPAQSAGLLRSEFGDNIAPVVIEDLSRTLVGDWMWKDDRSFRPELDELDEDQLRQLLQARTAQLVALIEKLGPAAGHNGPPEDIPLDEQERQRFLKAAQHAEAVAKGAGGLVALRDAWIAIRPIAAKLGKWLLSRVDDFGTEFAKAAGKTLGEKPYLLAAFPLAARLWQEWDHVEAIILHIAK